MTKTQKTIQIVGRLLRLQYSGQIREAQQEYDKLFFWCEIHGYDFAEVIEGAQAQLLALACGIHDTNAYLGEYNDDQEIQAPSLGSGS